MAKKTISLGRKDASSPRKAASRKPSNSQPEHQDWTYDPNDRISSDDAPVSDESSRYSSSYNEEFDEPYDFDALFGDNDAPPAQNNIADGDSSDSFDSFDSFDNLDFTDTYFAPESEEGSNSSPDVPPEAASGKTAAKPLINLSKEQITAAGHAALCRLGSECKRGVLTENPVLRLVLGTCPTLAVTTAASNAIGMGIAATLVLICSNTVISLLRRVIPDKVRIPAYITVIASFVSIVQMLVKAFAPSLDESLGIYLPLIVVNCIILGRAEMFASKHEPLASALDGFAMGVGFTTALLCMGMARELLGAGSLFGVTIISGNGLLQPILFFSLAPGGFFVFGLLIAAANRISRENNLPIRTGCGDCPAAATCSMSDRGGRR